MAFLFRARLQRRKQASRQQEIKEFPDTYISQNESTELESSDQDNITHHATSAKELQLSWTLEQILVRCPNEFLSIKMVEFANGTLAALLISICDLQILKAQ
jgi:hypothetical protein